MTTAEDTRLAGLQRKHAARWGIWKVHSEACTAWCVKPAGTKTGVHHEDSPDALDAWLRRVDALTDAGITITFHPGYKITATRSAASAQTPGQPPTTWTSPGSPTPATHGPAPVPDVLDHAEDTRARRTGLIQWLTTHPEETARHLTDAQIEDLIPHVPDDNARRVLQAILRQHAARREHHLARSQPPTSPLPLTPDTPTAETQAVPDRH